MNSNPDRYLEFKNLPSGIVDGKGYRDLRTCCTVFVCQEPFLPGDKIGWHMSISHGERNPTWEEIRDARYALLPDNITMAMYLPPIGEYVNIHNHCFHLFEAGR